MQHRHLKRAVQPIGWSTFRGGLQAVAKDTKRHYYGGETYEESRGFAKIVTLCGTFIPRPALPGAPKGHNPLDGRVHPMYPSDLAAADVCRKCERIKHELETANVDDNGRPIDGGA